MVTPLAMSPPSPVLHALVAKVSDPLHTTADVVDIIRVDAGMTAVLLQFGNSPFFARSGSRVATVDDAVLRVGETEVIRQIAACLTRWTWPARGAVMALLASSSGVGPSWRRLLPTNSPRETSANEISGRENAMAM